MEAATQTPTEERYDRYVDTLVGYEGDDTRARRPVDVGAIMREGVEPPDMLLPKWLVAGELHLLYADAEAGKTWLALRMAWSVMKLGHTVVWVDEELGDKVIAERLLALGAEDDVVSDKFVYLPFPGWDVQDEADILAWQALVASYKPGLVVVDTVTDALAESNLDENSGRDVTRWVKVFLEPARRRGVAQLVLDHITNAAASNGSPGRRAVGSRAKRAKAKVQYAMRTTAPYNREQVGSAFVEVTKNTRGALLPVERYLTIGGSPFQLSVAPNPPLNGKATAKASADVKLLDEIVDLLKRAGEPVSTNGVNGRVVARKSDVTNALKTLAGGPWPVRVENGPNRALLYVYDEAAGGSSNA